MHVLIASLVFENVVLLQIELLVLTLKLKLPTSVQSFPMKQFHYCDRMLLRV